MVRPHLPLTAGSWVVSTGHQINNHILPEMEVLKKNLHSFGKTSFCLRGREEGEREKRPGNWELPAAVRELDLRTPSIFSQACPAQPTATGRLAGGLRSVYMGFCLGAFGTILPSGGRQFLNLCLHR